MVSFPSLDSPLYLNIEADLSWGFVGRRERHARHFRQPVGQLLLDPPPPLFLSSPIKQTSSIRLPHDSLVALQVRLLDSCPIRAFITDLTAPSSPAGIARIPHLFLSFSPSLYTRATLVPASTLASSFWSTPRHRHSELPSFFRTPDLYFFTSWPRRTISPAPHLFQSPLLSFSACNFFFDLISKASLLESLAVAGQSWPRKVAFAASQPRPCPLPLFCPFCSKKMPCGRL